MIFAKTVPVQLATNAPTKLIIIMVVTVAKELFLINYLNEHDSHEKYKLIDVANYKKQKRSYIFSLENWHSFLNFMHSIFEILVSLKCLGNKIL